MEAWELGKKASLKQDCRGKGRKKGHLDTHRLPLVIPESYLKPHSHFPALPHLWMGGKAQPEETWQEDKAQLWKLLGWSHSLSMVRHTGWTQASVGCLRLHQIPTRHSSSKCSCHPSQTVKHNACDRGRNRLCCFNRLSFCSPSWP